jgi:hypothetical protein
LMVTVKNPKPGLSLPQTRLLLTLAPPCLQLPNPPPSLLPTPFRSSRSPLPPSRLPPLPPQQLPKPPVPVKLLSHPPLVLTS